MYLEETLHPVEFERSHETIDVPLDKMEQKLVDFLEHYGEPYLLDRQFCEVIGQGSGEAKLQRLLAATGYDQDPDGFFANVADQLARANSDQNRRFVVNGIELPYLVLLAMMTVMLPGDRFISVNSVERYEKLGNIEVPIDQRAALQRVLDTYPVRLSMHTVRQMRLSRDVAFQYAPFVEELDPVGQVNTWVGQFHDGLLERMYRNRVIFLLNMSCPVYCRFCFRKHKDLRNQTNPTAEKVRQAVDYVAHSPDIKEIVITGGDPFLNKQNMLTAVDGLQQVPHVQSLRLATRSVSYYPHLFYERDAFWLNWLKRKQLALKQAGKRLELATHFIHPDEISIESLDVITKLVKAGISVYVQTPFLEDCNEKGPELVRLFHLLRGAGAELHYIYIPCSPIHGNSIYWTPINKGHQVAAYLRAHLSDRIIPRICTATPIGKIDWHTSGWAVERDAVDDHFIWIRTPYRPEYYQTFAQNVEQQNVVRTNAEGTLDARFMAEIGDETLFWGTRPARVPKTITVDPDALQQAKALVLADQRIGFSLVPTGSDTLWRPHETRVEIDAEAGDDDLTAIGNDARISDVVITARCDAIEKLHEITTIVERLRSFQHVNAVRLRSVNFNYNPGFYSAGVVEKLGQLNHLAVSNPLRLEIETQFLHASEITPAHEALLKILRERGVTVYANTPLLSGINDSPDEMHQLAYALRQMGMEFHHLYVAGWPLQRQWDPAQAITVAEVIDIASEVRQYGSGREIPRYIILTALGEVDFGLTSRFVRHEDQLWVKLLCYGLDYFKGLDPAYQWPQGVRNDDAGHPMVTVAGLVADDDFMIR